MFPALTGRRPLSVLGALLAVVALALPAAAQSTGQVKGKVVDGAGQNIEGAQIVIEFTDGVTRRHETKTNRRGEFIQIGLQPGNYRVTAEKDGLAQSFDVRVRLAQMAEVNFVLAPGTAAPSAAAAAEDAKRAEALKKTFEEGAAASDAERYDEAIAKFNEVIAAVPRCAECHANIGSVHARQRQWEQAEAAYKRALEINPDLIDAYNGLATIYNAQGMFDEAAMGTEASTRASAFPGGGSADMLYNQGVIFWNSNRFPEALEQFERAIQANPSYAAAHFMLGRAYLNAGKLDEALKAFESYLELEPKGRDADEASKMVEMLRQMKG
jgi:Tfp pilus assembly protein PilF